MPTKQEHSFTYKDISDRKRKNLSILDYIRRRGPISRTDISKETGINIVSVSNYIMNYIRKGLVFECGLDISTGGRRPELVKLNLESAYVIGVDISQSKISAIITDLGLKVKAKSVFDRPKGNMEDVLNKTEDVIEDVLKKFTTEPSNIKIIGIGASGIIDILSGTIHDNDPERGRTRTNLYSLAKKIENKFNTQALVGNDATCAAFGELSLSAMPDITEMLYIYADIGCGIIINGDIYCGTSGRAGEIQLLLPALEKAKTATEIASYGIRGSDLGIVKKAIELIDKGEKTEILTLSGNDKNKITKEIIFEAAKKDDALAKELLVDAANWLGTKVAYLINLFNPQLVSIGGGVEGAGSVFMEALTNCVKMYSYEESFSVVKIMPSFLKEDAVALGAASLGARELFINA